MSSEIDDAALREFINHMAARKMTSRSYRQIRDEVYELAGSFYFAGSARHAINDLIRRRFGCRVRELREADRDNVLAFLAELRPRICQCKDIRYKFEEVAIKRVFGAAGEAALDLAPEDELAELDPLEMPTPPPIVYGGNVVRFPG